MNKFSEKLIIGVSSRALFDLEKENEIYKQKGVEGFREYQLKHEDKILSIGTAFPLIKSLLALNQLTEEPTVEVVVMSRNSPETGVRVLKSIQHYDLPIIRWAFSGGDPLAPFVDAFGIDLFLSKDEKDVQTIIDSSHCASALISNPPKNYQPETNRVKFAFDADAVVFSEASEKIYKEQGIAAFHLHESENEDIPLQDGPFADLLRKLGSIQQYIRQSSNLDAIRIAIVTARSTPSHMRVIKTLRKWNVFVDEAYFMGGLPKEKVLQAFRAHIFFDDQESHLIKSRDVVPSGKVLYKSNSSLRKYDKL